MMSNEDRNQSQLPPATGSSTEELGRESTPCPSWRIVEAEWECSSEDNNVRCGDNVNMVAIVRGDGSRNGVGVDFTVRHRHANQVIGSASDDTERHRAEAVWLSKKQCDVWDNPEAFFTARAGRDSRNSGNLSFYRYQDFSEDNVEVEGLDSPRVDISFAGGEYTLGVKVYIIPRTEDRREAHNASLTVDQIAEINASSGYADATTEQLQWASDMQRRIQAVFQDRWILHRRNCQRGESCDCPVSYHCCKFPLKVQVQILNFSEYNGQVDTSRPWNNSPAHIVNVWPNNGRDSTFDWYRGWSAANPCPSHRPWARQDCNACLDIYLDRQALVLAHEVGHYLGFYDEYPPSEGARTHPPDRACEEDGWRTEARTNLMGLSADGGSVGEDLPAYYFKPYRKFFSERLGEEFDLIPASGGGS